MADFTEKDGCLYIDGHKVLKAWESFSGWYWFAVKKIQTQDTVINGVTYFDDTIWYGLIQGHEEEWGDFSEAELKSMYPKVWEIPKKNLIYSGRRQFGFEPCSTTEPDSTESDELVRTVTYQGVQVKSDICLYESGYHNGGKLVLLSIYGSPQQVKAIYGALASGKIIETGSGTDSGTDISRSMWQPLRFRGTTLGYGKQHGLVWVENIGDYIIYRDDARCHAITETLKKRKIPFLSEWIPWIESMLRQKEYLKPLEGWGARGYACRWDDDAICEDIITWLNMAYLIRSSQ